MKDILDTADLPTQMGSPIYVDWRPRADAAVVARLKRLGERLSARDPARQVAEVQIRCAILNTFNALGMPDTVARA